jgi:putative flippase GtrA
MGNERQVLMHVSGGSDRRACGPVWDPHLALMAYLLDNRFIRFLLVGVLNTIFGYSVFAFFIFINVHYTVAALVSTICGILFNFKTTGRIVFGNRDNSLLVRFLGVYTITYVIGVSLLRVSTAYQWNLLIAAAVLMPPMAVVSYTLNRLFVFAPSS